jgi:hypothetical protein
VTDWHCSHRDCWNGQLRSSGDQLRALAEEWDGTIHRPSGSIAKSTSVPNRASQDDPRRFSRHEAIGCAGSGAAVVGGPMTGCGSERTWLFSSPFCPARPRPGRVKGVADSAAEGSRAVSGRGEDMSQGPGRGLAVGFYKLDASGRESSRAARWSSALALFERAREVARHCIRLGLGLPGGASVSCYGWVFLARRVAVLRWVAARSYRARRPCSAARGGRAPPPSASGRASAEGGGGASPLAPAAARLVRHRTCDDRGWWSASIASISTFNSSSPRLRAQNHDEVASQAIGL